MQIVWVLDSTEKIHPAELASGLLCNTGTDIFVTTTVEGFYENMNVCFYCMCMCECVWADARQQGYV